MEVKSACELINNLIYKPGWEFHAENNSRFEKTIKVSVVYPAQQSEREQALGGYKVEIEGGARATFSLTVHDCENIEALCYKLLTQVILVCEEHEAREFLRIAPTAWAPFHPHRADGIQRWAEMKGCDPVKDLVFGIA